MNRQRLAGIEKQFSRLVSKLLYEEVKNPKIEGLVSVVNCTITNDLRFADIYFSVMPTGDKILNEDKVIEGLNEVRGFLRKRVAHELKLRYTPEIRVHLDKTIEHGVRIAKLIDDVTK